MHHFTPGEIYDFLLSGYLVSKALLSLLKRSGVVSLSHRQKMASALGKACRPDSLHTAADAGDAQLFLIAHLLVLRERSAKLGARLAPPASMPLPPAATTNTPSAAPLVECEARRHA